MNYVEKQIISEANEFYFHFYFLINSRVYSCNKTKSIQKADLYSRNLFNSINLLNEI